MSAPAVSEKSIAQIFDEEVDHLANHPDPSQRIHRETAERMIAQRGGPQLWNEHVRRQNARVTPAPFAENDDTAAPPPRPIGLGKLLTLAQQAKLPAERQFDLAHAALQTADPAATIAKWGKDLAAGKPLPPASPVAGKSVDPCEPGGLAGAATALVGDDYTFLLQGVEELMLRHAAQFPVASAQSLHAVGERYFTAEQRLLFHRLQMTDYDLILEWNRCDRLLKAQRAAGTPADRSAARGQAQAAAAKFVGEKSEGVKLQKLIEESQARLAELEAERDSSAETIGQMDGAVRHIAQDARDENQMCSARIISDWPRDVVEYVEGFTGKEEGGPPLQIPPRISKRR